MLLLKSHFKPNTQVTYWYVTLLMFNLHVSNFQVFGFRLYQISEISKFSQRSSLSLKYEEIFKEVPYDRPDG